MGQKIGFRESLWFILVFNGLLKHPFHIIKELFPFLLIQEVGWG
jgi:hypothetical protein